MRTNVKPVADLRALRVAPHLPHRSLKASRLSTNSSCAGLAATVDAHAAVTSHIKNKTRENFTCAV